MAGSKWKETQSGSSKDSNNSAKRTAFARRLSQSLFRNVTGNLCAVLVAAMSFLLLALVAAWLDPILSVLERFVPISINRHPWPVRFSWPPIFDSIIDAQRPYAIVSAVLAGSALIAAIVLLWSLNNRRANFLSEANRRLQGEIAARTKLEEQLKCAKIAAEQAARQSEIAYRQLREAFEVVPEGLVLFDAEDRYVQWNCRYAEIYDQTDIAGGDRFEDALRAGIVKGQYPEAIGREEKWLADRLEHHRERMADHEQQLSDGRWLRIIERRTTDGGSVGIRIDITDLKQKEASLRSLFESNPIPMWVMDRSTRRFLAVNSAAVRHYGYTRDRFLRMTLLDILPEADPSDGDIHLHYVKLQARKVWRLLTAAGDEIVISSFSQPIFFEGHDAEMVASIDITAQKHAEDELRRTRKFFNTIVENVPVPIVVRNAADKRYAFVNRACEDFYGISREAIIGKTVYEVYPIETAEIITAHDDALLRDGNEMFFSEHSIRTPANEERIVTARALATSGATGEPEYLIAVVQDVTEKRNAEQQIRYLALHDALTDLPNRIAFNKFFQSVLTEGTQEPFAIMVLDIDRFKQINDFFGHPVGDSVLCEICRRLRTVMGEAFLGRVGGDEFVVIIKGGPQPGAASDLAERMLAAIGYDFEVEGRQIHTGLSIGVAVYPTDGTDAVTLMANADAALYRAKADGRGTVRFFQAEMDTKLHERRIIERDLRNAMSRGEFEVYYQPQALVSGVITGFEALARWRHPTLGMVSPATFIPIAEESGMIMNIGESILREACREAASWPNPLKVSVNLSPTQIHHGELPKLVHEVLLETGLSPHRLELEITEGVLVADLQRAISVLRRLKALGVHIAMDDFGTGYCSLSYLQSFPFDRIKIDKSFISNLGRNHQAAVIVRAVIALGRDLRMSVIAEGVEKRSEIEFLAREGCDEVQGYLIGKPLPIESYANFVGRGTTLDSARAAVV